ncbi:MAG: anaerobic glycerol-3-phosphate dehydrogenase subunit A [Desulfobacula sp.]|uniref:anaerobic glycerol-3-phosphate dehydrogenase subunit A n=1 Tax=Desulfobacula sp. TaxID=2593537 RepID=UPI0025C560BE|nr:anaerobic glycerol-3-phosphate dehydrogenase subunit A [Desulfobacula sp.]MCD4720258.1 anaerobic glycerol-3-phosphate dehydrogenase subunit A [Desulfobacula sp.]
MNKILETDILIIGGGVTGTGIARDLSLRGLKCILIDKSDLNAGASGGNHGLLHSGARYVCSDPKAAVECKNELEILKKNAGHCIEDTGGLFVAVKGDDEKYIADFPGMCKKSGVYCKKIDIAVAREMEPALSNDMIAAYEVKDASINPFKLSIENMNDAVFRGSQFLSFSKVKEFKIANNSIEYANVVNQMNEETFQIKAKTYVNASGAWADMVAAMAGVTINMVLSKGTLLVTSKRITKRVINRLRKATDGDTLVPGGVVSILGTTSVRIESPDNIYPTIKEVDHIVSEGEKIIPALKTCRYIRAYSGARPLVSQGDNEDDRNVSRGFALRDHKMDSVDNFITITGGKLSTYRLMAEKTSDLVCWKLSRFSKCLTKEIPLPSTKSAEWSEPGVLANVLFDSETLNDPILCECEMVPQSAIDTVINTIKETRGKPDLISIGLRSRIGKGPCQGAFCSLRILSHMVDSDIIQGHSNINDLKQFLNERWKGEQALLWDQALVQSSLKEMIHSGLFGLELAGNPV